MGTINPMRFVQAAPGIINGVLQATGSSVPLLGIAWESVTAMMGTYAQTTFTPQGYPAAASGDKLRLYEQEGMETMVIVGSGVTIVPNQFLTSDGSGNAVGVNPLTIAAGAYWIGGEAIEGGVAGDPIRVAVRRFCYTKPA